MSDLREMEDGRILLPDGREIKMGQIAPVDQPFRYAAVPAFDEANTRLPESEWREHDDRAAFSGPIKYQHYSNCTNASLAGAAECSMRAAGFPDVKPLSMSFIWAMFNGGNPNNGAMCRDVIGKFRQIGLPTAATWPESKYSIRGQVPQAVLDEAALARPLEVYQCMNFDDVATALTLGFDVYTGFALGKAFFQTRKDGKVPEWDGMTVNGHAMRHRGLTKRFGDWRTITPNTWSESFGDNGVGYVPKSYFWTQRGNFINLEAFAIRAPLVTTSDPLPVAQG